MDYGTFKYQCAHIIQLLSFFLKILFIYLTERDTAREGTQAGEWDREKQASHIAESQVPMLGWIPGFWDHVLSRRQMLKD